MRTLNADILNKEIQSMRKEVNLAIKELVQNLSKNISSLKAKKNNEEAEKCALEIENIKALKPESVALFALTNPDKETLEEILLKPVVTPETKAIAKVCQIKVLHEVVKDVIVKYRESIPLLNELLDAKYSQEDEVEGDDVNFEDSLNGSFGGNLEQTSENSDEESDAAEESEDGSDSSSQPEEKSTKTKEVKNVKKVVDPFFKTKDDLEYLTFGKINEKSSEKHSEKKEDDSSGEDIENGEEESEEGSSDENGDDGEKSLEGGESSFRGRGRGQFQGRGRGRGDFRGRGGDRGGRGGGYRGRGDGGRGGGGFRGGRGDYRGGRGGDFRGGRGSSRGDFRGRGSFRGGESRGRGGGSPFRGGGGGRGSGDSGYRGGRGGNRGDFRGRGRGGDFRGNRGGGDFRGNRGGGGGFKRYFDGNDSGAPPQKFQKFDKSPKSGGDGKMHPSWEAKKNLNKAPVAFEGKKVVFND